MSKCESSLLKGVLSADYGDCKLNAMANEFCVFSILKDKDFQSSIIISRSLKIN